MENIGFTILKQYHFPLLLKWLEAPHVKRWWDQDILYTLDSVREKYESYTKGYKIIDGIRKSIDAYIIIYNNQPIGYIQLYNAYDFPRSRSLIDLPKSLAAFDVFIGEIGYLKKGLGSIILSQFFKEYCKYDYIFADPDKDNIAAIKTYEKLGFKIIEKYDNNMWMLWKIINYNIIK